MFQARISIVLVSLMLLAAVTRIAPQPAHVTSSAIYESTDLFSLGGSSAGIEQSLTVKLQATEKDLEAGDAAAACAHLTSFINQARAHSGNKFSTIEANVLISSAERNKAVAGCS